MLSAGFLVERLVVGTKKVMLFRRLAAWARGVPSRVYQIPWRETTGEAFGMVALVIKAGCVVHITNKYIFGVAYVMGPSMLPTLNLSGDVVLIENISPRLERIGVGDIVVLRSPEDPRKTITKRVLGMEGDKVTFLVDPGNDERSKTVVVPKDHVWVQGDNIYSSRDSRRFGAVPYGLLVGRAFFRIWPLEGFGPLDS